MKNFIFAFILFALLLTVNAAPFKLNKRAITFGTCKTASPTTGPVDLLDVKIGNDPPVSGKNESFDVSGTMTRLNITEMTFVMIKYYDTEGRLIDAYAQFFTEPIKAGTNFTISVPDVPTPNLPDKYEIRVTIEACIDDEPICLNYVFACASANVGGSS
ncbi:hypothetical protein C2G38_2060904 [Gigaspora rosea]|uniref:Phosphatidylglycerol/phosphatidylinositol transfer protein n=1 Tax=Gigaspora rosea TaxID=44941 RepID=A0A397W3J3_9GLOM|nr:hypothetical protein C2G38_2060904 [Gigaspora rosea]